MASPETARGLGVGHQAVDAVAAEVAIAVRVGADNSGAAGAIASSGGSAKPSWVEGCTKTVA